MRFSEDAEILIPNALQPAEVDQVLLCDMIGRANTHGYNNPEVNALLDEAVTKTDYDELSELWKAAQRLIFTDVPGIPLYFEFSFAIVRNNVTGFVPPWGGLQLVSSENVVAIE